MGSATPRLLEVAMVFLKLGTVAFGGPAAHLALMEEEFVRRRKWLSAAEFLDLLGATQLIPGPSSTEMAAHLGRCRAGWPGLVVAGACFILPSALIVTVLAWAYVRYQTLPALEGVLAGVKPVMMAIIAQALWNLGRSALKDRLLIALAVAGAVAGLAGMNELLVLALLGVVSMAWRGGAGPAGSGEGGPGRAAILGADVGGMPWAAAGAGAGVGVAAAGSAVVPFSLTALGWFFLKVGSVLFGSGYVLLAFLKADLVDRWGWLTEAQLLDAITVGQVTPGPVFTTATFIGYVLGGGAGAVVATVGIFLPGFVLVALSGPLIPRLRASPRAGAFLDGVNVASLALMAVVTWHLGRTSLVSPWALLLGAASLGAMVRWRVNSAVLIAIGALVGGMGWIP